MEHDSQQPTNGSYLHSRKRNRVRELRENKLKVLSMRNECIKQQKSRHAPFRLLREQLLEAEQRQQNFKYVQESLQELDSVHKMVLPSMFDVAHQNYNEQQEVISEAAYEFKMDNMDPKRIVNKYEAERFNKERKKNAQRRHLK